eukprot:SAG22_NODE_3450_length_1705_cov_1.362391_3_plen_53_part_01
MHFSAFPCDCTALTEDRCLQLIFFSSDNGGWVSKNGTAGGSNFPLTGGKYKNW